MFEELGNVYSQMDSNVSPSGDLGTFEGIANLVANIMVGAASSISFITLAYAFIQFQTAQGDPKGIEKAQHAALYSAIATLVALLAYGIKIMVFSTIGAGQ
jgi:hypothetical protein